MTYQLETDGDILIESFELPQALVEAIQDYGLTDGDYAIVQGHVIKGFDDPASKLFARSPAAFLVSKDSPDLTTPL